MVTVLLFVILISTVGCSPWEMGAEKNVEKNGIKFDTFRENDDGTKIGNLAEDTVIESWPCRQGFVSFHADWRLDECHLSREYERNGIVMPEGTRVFPDRRGNPGVCLFPHDVEIQGYRCRGNKRGGFMTAFYPYGQLHWFYSRDPVEVDGVTCKDSLTEAIYLHPDGRLQQCKLEKAIKTGGVEYQKGSIIQFDRAGKASSK
jgi:hypothetical protein